MSNSSDNMSTKEFMLSKESRPLLIGVLALLVIFGGIFYWAISSLFGESVKPDANSLATSGSSALEAPRSRHGGPTNLTSGSLSEEAKAAARQYNSSTATDDSLHPAPLFDDVTYLPTKASTEAEEAQKKTNVPDENNPQRYVYTPPAIPESRNSNSQRQQEADRREKEERIRARQDAARALLQTYESQPAIASVAFKREDDSSKKGQGDLTRVEARQGQDGRLETAYVEGNSTGRGNANECKYPLVKGGEIAYANNDIALNTDFEGPLRMTFLGGELNGWVGMGSFKLNEFGAKMKAKVSKLTSPAGTEYSAQGYVLDPDTTLWAIRSDVDRHIIYRYGGFGLATVLSGFQDLAEARSVMSQQTGPNGEITNEYREPDGKQITWTLLGAFSELWRQAFAENINRPITVTLDPDVQVGVLFETTVCRTDSEAEKTWAEAEAKRRAGLVDPVKTSG